MDNFLIETDFLFGLRPSDKYNSHIKKALNLAKEKKVQFKLASSAIFECRAVLYSQGKTPAEVSKILLFMKKKLEDCGIKEEFVDFDDFILADHLRSNHKKLTFFDSLHAAISQRRKIPLFGNDKILQQLNFITKTFQDSLINELK
ncbi:MAG: hypothetical protein ACTSRS_20160 [Candidatus Helarchaeota archaeon]